MPRQPASCFASSLALFHALAPLLHLQVAGPLSLPAMLADLVRQADDGHQRVTLSITGEESGPGRQR